MLQIGYNMFLSFLGNKKVDDKPAGDKDAKYGADQVHFGRLESFSPGSKVSLALGQDLKVDVETEVRRWNVVTSLWHGVRGRSPLTPRGQQFRNSQEARSWIRFQRSWQRADTGRLALLASIISLSSQPPSTPEAPLNVPTEIEPS